MKIPNAKIEGVASKECVRYVLCNVQLAKGKLTASDGKMLAQIPVETDEGDVDGYISPEVFAEARKQKVFGSVKRSVALKESTAVFVTGTVMPRVTLAAEMSYPDTSSFIADAEERSKAPPTVVLDARLLLRLAEAIRREEDKPTSPASVCLWVDGEKPIIVRPYGREAGRIGVCMPLTPPK